MGTCKYCGKYVGLFSSVHKRCAEKFNTEVKQNCSTSNVISPNNFEWLPDNKVSLSEALRLVVINRGVNSLVDGQTINLLYDAVDFSDHAAAKSVLRELIYNNALHKVIGECDNKRMNHQLELVKIRAVNDFGFNDTIVDYVISSIRYSLGIETSIGEEVNLSHECPEDISCNQPIEKSQKKINNLIFWGIPMGQSILPFKSLLEKQGYGVKPYNNSKEVGISCGAYGYTKEFLDYGSHIYVYESPYSHIVYKVDVWFYDMFKRAPKLYEEIYPLLIQKYGKPYHDDKIHKKGPSEGKGVIFKIPEGEISFLFGSYDRIGGFLLHLTYEDKSTLTAITPELSRFEKEVRLKKEREELNHRNKLVNDI